LKNDYVVLGAILLIIGCLIFITQYQRYVDLSSGLGQFARYLNPSLQREYEQIVIPGLIVGSVMGILGFVLFLVGVQAEEVPRKEEIKPVEERPTSQVIREVKEKRCKKCGAVIPPKAKFCNSCGARIGLKPAYKYAIVAVVILIVALIPVSLYMTQPILEARNTTSESGWDLTRGFYVTVRGEIFNEGFRPAYNVRVRVIGYDTLGNEVESGYCTIREVPAKGSTNFNVLLDIEMGETVSSHKVDLQYNIWALA
jgi:ribosomal protein L40E